jgi:hypothetical protein
MIDDIPTDVLLETRLPKRFGEPLKRGKVRETSIVSVRIVFSL